MFLFANSTSSVSVLGFGQFVDYSYYVPNNNKAPSASLQIFEWMPNIVNFTFLVAGYFGVPINILELSSET